jgi:DNA polymerase-3 subunit epsilon
MFIYVDLETTGFDANNDQIWEVGMLKTQGCKPIDIYQQLFSVTCPIPVEVLAQSNMESDMLSAFPAFSSKRDDVRKFIGNGILVAYNAQFEQRFLIAKGVIPSSQRVIDLYAWVKDMRLPTPNNKLQTILRYYGFTSSAPHRAINDAFALYGLVCKLGWLNRLSSAYISEDDNQGPCRVKAELY